MTGGYFKLLVGFFALQNIALWFVVLLREPGTPLDGALCVGAAVLNVLAFLGIFFFEQESRRKQSKSGVML